MTRFSRRIFALAALVLFSGYGWAATIWTTTGDGIGIGTIDSSTGIGTAVGSTGQSEGWAAAFVNEYRTPVR